MPTRLVHVKAHTVHVKAHTRRVKVKAGATRKRKTTRRR